MGREEDEGALWGGREDGREEGGRREKGREEGREEGGGEEAVASSEYRERRGGRGGEWRREEGRTQ
jgi:hypothetical protein